MERESLALTARLVPTAQVSIGSAAAAASRGKLLMPTATKLQQACWRSSELLRAVVLSPPRLLLLLLSGRTTGSGVQWHARLTRDFVVGDGSDASSGGLGCCCCCCCFERTCVKRESLVLPPD